MFVEMFVFGMHLSASALFGQINRRVPELLAGVLISPVAVGFYRVASRMVNTLFDLTITPIQRTAIAGFSRLEGTDALVRGYRTVTKVVAVVAFPAFFGMAALADDLVALVFGAKWEESAFVMSMLALSGGIASVTYFVQPLLAVAGQSRWGAIISFQGLVLNILVCLITAPFGMAALAIGFAVRGYVGVISMLLFLRRAVGLPPRNVLSDIFPSFFCAAVMLLVILAVRFYALTDYSRTLCLLILVPLGVVVYTSMLVVFFRTFVREIGREVEPLLGPVLQRLRKH